jgi:hypothetical protein
MAGYALIEDDGPLYPPPHAALSIAASQRA